MQHAAATQVLMKKSKPLYFDGLYGMIYCLNRSQKVTLMNTCIHYLQTCGMVPRHRALLPWVLIMQGTMPRVELGNSCWYVDIGAVCRRIRHLSSGATSMFAKVRQVPLVMIYLMACFLRGLISPRPLRLRLASTRFLAHSVKRIIPKVLFTCLLSAFFSDSRSDMITRRLNL